MSRVIQMFKYTESKGPPTTKGEMLCTAIKRRHNPYIFLYMSAESLTRPCAAFDFRQPPLVGLLVFVV